jgi:hypothetical protein
MGEQASTSMQRAAIIIKDPQQHYEGLRTSVGLLLAGMKVQMFVLHHEIENMDEAYSDNMAFLDEIGGQRFSNNSENAEKYDFSHVTIAQAADKIRQADIVIPF